MSIESIAERRVQTLPPDATCREAATLMRDENIGTVVVAEDRRPLGIVTDRDLAIRMVADGMEPDKTALRDVMSGEPIFVGGERSIDQVIAAMRNLSIRRVPLVDADGELCGLVSMDDLVMLLADQLGDLADAIREELDHPE
jgi:CBS domain-containing protein